jgi:hypothetical protein
LSSHFCKLITLSSKKSFFLLPNKTKSESRIGDNQCVRCAIAKKSVSQNCKHLF